MPYSQLRYSHYRSPKRTVGKGKIKKIFFAIIFLGLIFFSLVKFVQFIFSDEIDQNKEAIVSVVAGRAEFNLFENDLWTEILSAEEQNFFEGDSIRTNSNSKLSIKLKNESEFFLNEHTHITFKSLASNNIIIELHSGEIWGNALVNENESDIQIVTPKSKILAKNSIFDINSESGKDIIRGIKGEVSVEILESGFKLPKPITIGQKIVLDAENINAIQNNEDIIEKYSQEFETSDWHLNNLEKFVPQEAIQIRRRVEIENQRQEKAVIVEGELASPQILTPANNSVVSSATKILKIEGTAPPEAYQISVDGFVLTKFEPGAKKWSYFASTKFGTLKPGVNTYNVIAYSRDGKESAPTQLTITYEGENTNILQGDPQAPQIITPALLTEKDIYQTASNALTILGKVVPETQKVTVNGYNLQKFQTGMTEFSYIASLENGLLKKGVNEYKIVAELKDGSKHETVVKVQYTPLDL